MHRIDIRWLRRSPGRVAVVALSTVALVVTLTAAYFASSDNADAAGAAALAAQKEFVFPLHPAPVPVPELTFEDSQGRKHTLADFRGKLVLLNLWATWCVPC